LLEDMVSQKIIPPIDVGKGLTDSQPRWHNVGTWTVRGSKETETFSVRSHTWRVTWSTGRGNLVNITVRNAVGRIITFAAGEGTEHSIVRAPPGTYYLEITSILAPATVTVEEPD